MSRITIPSVEESHASTKPLLAAVHQQLGVIPNLMKLIGHSPAALEGYLSLNGAIAKGKLSPQLREQIALAIAERNGCDYCLSAHDYLGRNVAKLSQADIDSAREGHANDPRSNAALKFSLQVSASHGRVSDADLGALRSAGFDEASTIEIVTTVALNILTNYINNVAQTDVDFPKVSAKPKA
jgi:uncharacterized peroxidase-related enzyme